VSIRRLVGREGEIARAHELLDGGARLVTFAGPPGVGTTTLLRHVARDLGGARDVRIVKLGDVRREDVLGTIARALGLAAGRRGRDATIARVAERLEALGLVLAVDEADRVLDEVAGLVTSWLDAASSLAVLVSSRERLDVSLEHVVRVDPLAEDYAVTLLLEAVGRAARGRPPTLAEARRLVARVDGLPLGIELLASRVAAVGVAGVLEHALSIPPLEAAVSASVDALAESERSGLAALSVFEGGFSCEAACSVLDADASSLVARLVDASLLEHGEVGPDARFEMLTVVRTVARRELAASGRGKAVSARHCATYVELAQTGDRDLAPDRANLLVAFAHAVEAGEGTDARRLAIALDDVLVRQGPGRAPSRRSGTCHRVAVGSCERRGARERRPPCSSALLRAARKVP
jgi:predicted ATPase